VEPSTLKKKPDEKKPVERVAFTIGEFCARNGICKWNYHNLKRKGQAPREMHLGNAIRITLEAERDWQREREQFNSTRRQNTKRREAHTRRIAKLAVASPEHVSKRKGAHE
jgi:hypothetical protein